MGGHFGPVQDCSWDPTSSYLVSVSADETARLAGPWRREIGGKTVTTWHELGRPQVHGHEIECITFLKDFQFASGAEEKVIRVFDAPQSFLQSFSNISGAQISPKLIEARALTAATPALGLSNKAIFEGQEAVQADSTEFELQDDEEGGAEGDSQSALDLRPVILNRPPYEEQLFQGTLWVEVEKM